MGIRTWCTPLLLSLVPQDTRYRRIVGISAEEAWVEAQALPVACLLDAVLYVHP